jgi:hypothetical protein
MPHLPGVIVVLMLLAAPVSAWAYYVAPNGDDSADGSARHPWATIQHAADMVKPGDTVHVASGEYHQALNSKASGTPEARIRFVSDIRWGAKIRTVGSKLIWVNHGDYVDIEGFDISGDGWYGIANRASHVRIVGNRIHDIPARDSGSNGGAAIENANYSGRDSDIIGNVVYNIGNLESSDPRVHGIYIANLGGHIVNNIAYRCQAWGIYSWHAARDAVVANNLVFENERGGIIVGNGDAPGGVLADNFLVTNNIAIHNKGYGIIEYGDQVGTHNRYLNNLVFGNELGGLHLLHSNLEQGTVAADPKLVNYRPDGTGDYHLGPGSPAIEAGTRLGTPGTDFDGVIRPQGASVDIGPFEHR